MTYQFLRRLPPLAIVSLVSFAFLSPNSAYATKDVSSPTVAKGKLKAEARYGFEQDDESASRDNRFRQVYLVEYGVTEWWSTRMNARLTELDGQDLDYTATEWENKFQLFFEKKDGFSGGFKLVYSFADNTGSPDSVEVKGMVERKFGDLKLRGNLGLLWDVGDFATRDALLTSAVQGIVPVNDHLGLGVELFSEYGEIANIQDFDLQEHQLGPVLTYKLSDAFSIETGYLFGISDRASDGLVKFFVKGTF